MCSVEEWLQTLGLAHFGPLFAESEIDLEAARLLTEQDLEKLGIPLGPRRKLLHAIAALRATVADPGSSQGAAAEAIPQTVHIADAERRHLTVLFCDLVGSTELSRKLDPEDYREIVCTYQRFCAEIVARYEGHIAQYLGDGMLVYFGFPRAHEDDARRAVLTGLGMVQGISQIAHAGGALRARVGIHTGLAVVGEIGALGAQERLALGETPNIAARLEGLAEPGTVVVSGATQRLLADLFHLLPLGPRLLKGVERPLEVYRVLGASSVQATLDAKGGLTALVGREQELSLLADRWERAADGQGQVVVLTGEPGIGKSRLVRALRERLAGTDHRWIETRCSPYFMHTPLFPIVDVLPRAVGLAPGEAPEAEMLKLEELLAVHRIDPVEAVPLLAMLLSRPIPPQRPLPPMSPERQRRRTLEVIVALLLGLASERSALLVIEDLHWVDPTTLELISQLVGQVPTGNILLILTARPDFSPPWGARSYLSALTLNRLTRRQTEQVVLQLAGGAMLPTELQRQIVERTDGVPLFVEELTKTVLESGLVEQVGGRYLLTGASTDLAIPATLHESLMARLDRMNTAKETAQLAATIGRAFRYNWLRAVTTLDEGPLQRALRQLVEAEVLFQRGQPPEASYTFKHALIQDAAYQSLLKSTRQEYHARIARALIDGSTELAQAQPAVVAHHLTEASQYEPAIGYWEQAAHSAMQRSAHVETIAHLRRALDLAAALPSPAKEEREVDLRLALGFAFIPVKGWAAAESVEAFERALALLGDTGDVIKRFRAFYGLDLVYTVRGDHRRALALGESALALAERTRDSDLLIYGHGATGWNLVWMGRFTDSLRHQQAVLRHYQPERHSSNVAVYGYDVKSAALRWLSYGLWALGYPDQARVHADEALTWAESLRHPHSVVIAMDHLCWLYSALREWDRALEAATRQEQLAGEQGFGFFATTAKYFRGEALVRLDRAVEGVELIRQFESTWVEYGCGNFWPPLLSSLGLGLAKRERCEEASEQLAEAIRRIEKQDERCWESATHRTHGEVNLLHDPPRVPEAEAAFQRALQVARRQQAKSLELQAAISLARLWRSHDRGKEAYELLAPIYSWFSEGFGTKDLKEAKTLLEELSA